MNAELSKAHHIEMNICMWDSDEATYADLLSAQKQNSVAQLSIWIHRQWNKMFIPLVPALSFPSTEPIFHLQHWILSLNKGEKNTWTLTQIVYRVVGTSI